MKRRNLLKALLLIPFGLLGKNNIEEEANYIFAEEANYISALQKKSDVVYSLICKSEKR
jgi:hypothetical protein